MRPNAGHRRGRGQAHPGGKRELWAREGQGAGRRADTQILVSYRSTSFIGDGPSPVWPAQLREIVRPTCKGLSGTDLAFRCGCSMCSSGQSTFCCCKVGEGEADEVIAFAKLAASPRAYGGDASAMRCDRIAI